MSDRVHGEVAKSFVSPFFAFAATWNSCRLISADCSSCVAQHSQPAVTVA
jgi:hypothetical protein